MQNEIAPSKTLFTVHSQHRRFLYDPHNGNFSVCGETQSYAPDCHLAVAGEVVDEEQDITPAPLSEALPFLRVTTDDEPHDAQIGFLFGSDPEVCDVLLDKDPARGISKRQFAIHVTQQHGVLLIINRSRNKTNVEARSFGKLALSSQRALQDNESVHVSLGIYDIEIRLPDHSAHLADYRTELSNFTRRISSQIPVFQNLELESGPSASTASLRASPYQLREKVGSGTYGVVYRAVHRVTGDVVAVKQLGKHEHMRLEEVMLLRNITHEHIVSFHAFIIEIDSFHLVMEFVDGQNLETAFKAHHPTSTELREVMRQQLSAVEYIHHRGIVHRDIKPPNVMVKWRDPMVTKLTDFGLAIRSTELADKAPLCGTASYAAPEVLRGILYNEKVDIWSLGILFLQYSHKLPPLPKHDSKPRGQTNWGSWGSWPDKVQQHLQHMPRSPAFQFTSALLTANPEVRPSAKDALAHPFFSSELGISSPAGKTSAEQSGDDLGSQDTIRASPSRQGLQDVPSSTGSQSDNLPATEIHYPVTVVPGIETGSPSLERHAKRQKNGANSSLSEVARFLESIEDPLESFLFGRNLNATGSETSETPMFGGASHEEDSELPSLGWNVNQITPSERDTQLSGLGLEYQPHSIRPYEQEQRELTREIIQNTPREHEGQHIPINVYELNLPLKRPPGYKVMRYDKQRIAYHPFLQRVNITSVLRLANIQRQQGLQWTKNRQCVCTTMKGSPYIQGTYLTFDDAASCCSDLSAGQAAMRLRPTSTYLLPNLHRNANQRNANQRNANQRNASK
ncbi:Putative serine/threonine-protein kinase Atg1 [Colletotrichum destructivum]|uniref:Autophagy-related protein 1 n=1 Tax=Colletotrichum destructivum TaxID=34406 RepID=A0AAX4J1E8_9PEZI|nr:Putative serine/threonine-protein kinase Atg1 [Colletotrichum destructivum]